MICRACSLLLSCNLCLRSRGGATRKMAGILLDFLIPMDHYAVPISFFLFPTIYGGILADVRVRVQHCLYVHNGTAEDDEAVHASVARFVNKTMALLEKERLLHKWVYPNYANKMQDLFAGYGEENREKLREIQGKYDTEAVFAKLSKGYFKI